MKLIFTLLLVSNILTVSAQNTRYRGLTPNDHKLLVNPSVYDGHGVIPICSCLKKKNGKFYLNNDNQTYQGWCVVLQNSNLNDTVVYFSRNKNHLKHVTVKPEKYWFIDYSYHFKRVVNNDTIMTDCDSTEFQIISSYTKGQRHGSRIYLTNGKRTKKEEYWKGELIFYTNYFFDSTYWSLDSIDQKKSNFSFSSYSIPCCTCLKKRNGLWFETDSETPFDGHCSVIDTLNIKEPLLLISLSNSTKFHTALRNLDKLTLSTKGFSGKGYHSVDAIGHPVVTFGPYLRSSQVKLISSYRNGLRHGERLYYKNGKVERIELYYYGQLFSETIFIDSKWAEHPKSY